MIALPPVCAAVPLIGDFFTAKRGLIYSRPEEQSMPRLFRQSGFTLIELMVAVAVLAILLTLAVPSFAGLMRSSQVSSQTNSLVTAFNVARSEASKRGMPVTVCAADAGLADCSASAADWKNGWLIITDLGAPGKLDLAAGDMLLEKSVAASEQLQLKTEYSFVRFNANGARMNGDAAVIEMPFNVRHTVCTGTDQRSVQVNRNGRISTIKSACT